MPLFTAASGESALQQGCLQLVEVSEKLRAARSALHTTRARARLQNARRCAIVPSMSAPKVWAGTVSRPRTSVAKMKCTTGEFCSRRLPRGASRDAAQCGAAARPRAAPCPRPRQFVEYKCRLIRPLRGTRPRLLATPSFSAAANGGQSQAFVRLSSRAHRSQSRGQSSALHRPSEPHVRRPRSVAMELTNRT